MKKSKTYKDRPKKVITNDPKVQNALQEQFNIPYHPAFTCIHLRTWAKLKVYALTPIKSYHFSVMRKIHLFGI